MKISINGNVSDISAEEKQAYIEDIQQKYPDDKIEEITLYFGDDGLKAIMVSVQPHGK